MINRHDVIDFSRATPDERAATLGEEFRSIDVTNLTVTTTAGVVTMLVQFLMDGQLISLIGDPQTALETFLSGLSHGETLQ